MALPKNLFKARLKENKIQLGLWLGLANPYTSEICAGAGFDWLVIDAEHGPNDLQLILSQLQALSAFPVAPIVRPPQGETWIIKQLLDIGAQTLLIPMVETAEQAQELVNAMRYPPLGKRGVGASLARASSFNRIPNYLNTASEELCLIVQIENQLGLSNLKEIANVAGVDGVFIGPADLAADMGFLGEPNAKPVQQAVIDAIKKMNSINKPVGLLTTNQDFANKCISSGVNFIAVGIDVMLLASVSTELISRYKHLFDKFSSN